MDFTIELLTALHFYLMVPNVVLDKTEGASDGVDNLIDTVWDGFSCRRFSF